MLLPLVAVTLLLGAASATSVFATDASLAALVHAAAARVGHGKPSTARASEAKKHREHHHRHHESHKKHEQTSVQQFVQHVGKQTKQPAATAQLSHMSATVGGVHRSLGHASAPGSVKLEVHHGRPNLYKLAASADHRPTHTSLTAATYVRPAHVHALMHFTLARQAAAAAAATSGAHGELLGAALDVHRGAPASLSASRAAGIMSVHEQRRAKFEAAATALDANCSQQAHRVRDEHNDADAAAVLVAQCRHDVSALLGLASAEFDAAMRVAALPRHHTASGDSATADDGDEPDAAMAAMAVQARHSMNVSTALLAVCGALVMAATVLMLGAYAVRRAGEQLPRKPHSNSTATGDSYAVLLDATHEVARFATQSTSSASSVQSATAGTASSDELSDDDGDGNDHQHHHRNGRRARKPHRVAAVRVVGSATPSAHQPLPPVPPVVIAVDTECDQSIGEVDDNAADFTSCSEQLALQPQHMQTVRRAPKQ